MGRFIQKIDNFLDTTAVKLEERKMTLPINIVGSVIFIVVSSVLLMFSSYSNKN